MASLSDYAKAIVKADFPNAFALSPAGRDQKGWVIWTGSGDKLYPGGLRVRNFPIDHATSSTEQIAWINAAQWLTGLSTLEASTDNLDSFLLKITTEKE